MSRHPLSEADINRLIAVASEMTVGDKVELSKFSAELDMSQSWLRGLAETTWSLAVAPHIREGSTGRANYACHAIVNRWREHCAEFDSPNSHVKGLAWTRAELEQLEADVESSNKSAVAQKNGMSRANVDKLLGKLRRMREADMPLTTSTFRDLASPSTAKVVAKKRNPLTKSPISKGKK